MDAVRDHGFTNEISNFFGSADHFLDAVRGAARLLRLDRQAGQTRRLALWCEASGMVPQLQRIAVPFGIGVYSSGGFDSVTAKHQIARLWTDEPITVLHVGDHDPSGVQIAQWVHTSIIGQDTMPRETVFLSVSWLR